MLTSTLAESLSGQGKYKEALPLFQRSEDLLVEGTSSNEDMIEILKNHIECLTKSGDADGAANLQKKLDKLSSKREN